MRSTFSYYHSELYHPVQEVGVFERNLEMWRGAPYEEFREDHELSKENMYTFHTLFLCSEWVDILYVLGPVLIVNTVTIYITPLRVIEQVLFYYQRGLLCLDLAPRRRQLDVANAAGWRHVGVNIKPNLNLTTNRNVT